MLGLKKNIRTAIEERIKRLEAVCLKLPEFTGQKPELYERWSEIKDSIQSHQEKVGDAGLRDKFLEAVARRISTSGKNYIDVIQGLAAQDSEIGVCWLQEIVNVEFGHLYLF